MGIMSRLRRQNKGPRELTAEEKQAVQVKFIQCKAEIDAVCKKYGFAIRVGPPTVDLVPVQNPIG